MLRSLKMYTLVTKAVRAAVDEKHLSFMKREIAAILENDHMCFREDEESGNSYKTQLSFLQKEAQDVIFAFMKREFGITLNVFRGIVDVEQHPSARKIDEILADMDPFLVTVVF